MAEPSLTFVELSNKFLAWCKSHQSPRTHEWYANYLNMFTAYPGIVDIEMMDLKPYHVQEWIDSHGEKWGNNYRGGAAVAVKRVYNWAEEQGYVDNSPIKKLKKPPATRRKIYMKNEDYEAVLRLVAPDDSFRDLLIFVWVTGCRPQEVRHIERRHVFLDRKRIVFPAEESKGKRTERIIRMSPVALEIVERLMAVVQEGKLFRNTNGDPWTKFAICARFDTYSKKIGKRMFCYAARHGFGTRKLIQGHDPITVAGLMGHTDGSMLAKVYSHVDEDDEHMSKALMD